MWDKVAELIIFMFRTVCIFESSFKKVKITIEIMFLISINVVFDWWFGWFPLILFPQCLSSHIKLNVLLKSEVCATISIWKPVDSLFFENRTQDQPSKSLEEVKDILFVLIETQEEKPEWTIIYFLCKSIIKCIFIFKLFQKWSWVANHEHGNIKAELEFPNSVSECDEFVECLLVVFLGYHTCNS